MAKIPTNEEFNNYDGAHCSNLWKQLDDNWKCPACRRTKREIMRWTKRYYRGGKGPFYWGWMAGLHKHHDHGGDCFNSGISRFPRTTICDQCNAADGRAKKILKLPSSFSFSPEEINQFIRARPHRPHETDYQKAEQLFHTIVERDRLIF